MSKTIKQGRKPQDVDSDKAAVESYLNGPEFTPPGGSESDLRAEIARLQAELKRVSEPKRQIQRVSKADLLLAASQKDVRYFVQFDWFRGDEEQFRGVVADLRITDCVRIQVPVGLSHADALGAIDALRKWIAECPDAFHCEVAPEYPADDLPF